jgi:hypothetical protein
MSFYCKSCREDLGELTVIADRHRSLGHSVAGYPLIL